MKQAATDPRAIQLFLCYRRADGAWHAESLHALLNGSSYIDADGVPCRLHVYYDRTAPGVADWKKLHFPSLQSSHALLLICTPGVATDLSEGGSPDWVYRELRWWRDNRNAAPIVVDATGEGHRWLPEFIRRKWPDINRIDFIRDHSWSGKAPSEVSDRVSARVIGSILESERATVFDNLERFRKLTRRLSIAIACLLLLLLGAIIAVVVAKEARQRSLEQAFANASYIFSDSDPTLALGFSRGAGNTVTATFSMLRAFNSGSWFYSHRVDGAWDGDLDRTGRRLAWIITGNKLHILNLETGEAKEKDVSSSNVRFVPSGNLVLWSGGSGRGTPGHIEVVTADGDLVARHEFQFLIPVFASDGTVMAPSFEGDQIVVQVVDSETGAVTKLSLGADVKSLGANFAAFPDGTGVVAATTIPGRLVVARFDHDRVVLEIPSKFHAVDLAIDSGGRYAIVYLSGASRGVSDALGWIDFMAPESLGIRVVPLQISPGFDSGGRVRFLSQEQVIASSTDGWTRIVDFKTGESREMATRSRAADVVEVSPDGDQVFIGRRSGVVSIHSSDGVPLGRLLGESHSDGLNPVFQRMAIDDAGTMILTVARTGIRLWRRPTYQLTVPHESSFLAFDELPEAVLSPFRNARTTGSAALAKACSGTSQIRVDDSGEIGFCVQIGDRVDVIPTGLSKGEIDIVGSGEVDGIGHRLIGERVNRVFVLSPELIRVLVEEQARLGGLWLIDETLENTWTEQRH